jgi:PAS domain S-box-containing protein
MIPIFDGDVAKMMADRLPALFVDGGAAGTILWHNAAAERLFGYTEYNELRGMCVDQLVPPELRDQHPANRAKLTTDPGGELMAGGKPLSALRKDGTALPVNIWLVRGTLSGTRGVLAVIFDLSSRVM